MRPDIVRTNYPLVMILPPWTTQEKKWNKHQEQFSDRGGGLCSKLDKLKDYWACVD